MNKKWLAAMLGVAAMTLSAGAMAQQADAGWYAGVSIGQADLGPDEDTSFKLSAGYQLNRTFAVELGYTNLGEVSVPGASVEATAWELLGVAKLPVGNQFSIYGLAGLAMIEVDTTIFGLSSSDDSTDLTFGFGAQYNFSPKLGVRAQWQTYEADDADADVISVGIVYKF